MMAYLSVDWQQPQPTKLLASVSFLVYVAAEWDLSIFILIFEKCRLIPLGRNFLRSNGSQTRGEGLLKTGHSVYVSTATCSSVGLVEVNRAQDQSGGRLEL